MMYTTVPSITISLIIYLIVGLQFGGKEVEITQYTTALDASFNISWWTMLVPLFTGFLIYKKVPSLITLVLSSFAACICALVLQSGVVSGIGNEGAVTATSLLQGIMKVCFTSTHIDTGYDSINSLVATRGMAGMLDTIWLILCAF